MRVEENRTRNFSPDAEEDSWLRKKRAVLEQYVREGNDRRVDLSELLEHMALMRQEISELEDRRDEQAGVFKDLQRKIDQETRKRQSLTEESEKRKKNLVRTRTIESSLINEIDFFESEKNDLAKRHRLSETEFESNLLSLKKSVKNIGFMRGETGSILEKMSVLEENVPEQSTNINDLDQTISGTLKALRELHEKMAAMENRFKADYYRNKKQEEQG